MFCGDTDIGPLLAAGGPVTFVATKVTKKAFSRNASLRSWALPCKTSRTWAANSCPAALAHSYASANICYALQPHKPNIVLPVFIRSLSADKKEEKVLKFDQFQFRQKVRERPDRKAGLGVLPVRGSFFLSYLALLGLFSFHQGKEKALPAANERVDFSSTTKFSVI